MTVPTEVRAEISRLKTTRPEDGTEPRPRDPVSIRAQIGSLAEDRKREIVARLRVLRRESRALKLELADLDDALDAVGITSEEE